MPTNALYMQQPPPTHPHYAPQQQQQQQLPPIMHDNVQDSMQQQKSQHLWPPNAGVATGTGSAPTPQSANGTAMTLNLASQLDAIKMQQNTLREQIKQSDANLSAQHTVNNLLFPFSLSLSLLAGVTSIYI